MVGNVVGKHRSPHRGSSVEFAEYRKYVPGDDTRRLDWKAYARSDRHYIKEFEADTNLRAYFSRGKVPATAWPLCLDMVSHGVFTEDRALRSTQNHTHGGIEAGKGGGW